MNCITSKSFSLRVLVLLLVAGLLYVQWAYAQHQVQWDHLHKPDHTCEWCLMHGQLDNAAVSVASSVPAVSYHVWQPRPARALHGAAALSFYGARAPPVTFPL